MARRALQVQPYGERNDAAITSSGVLGNHVRLVANHVLKTLLTVAAG
jgi:hypothetical protein